VYGIVSHATEGHQSGFGPFARPGSGGGRPAGVLQEEEARLLGAHENGKVSTHWRAVVVIDWQTALVSRALHSITATDKGRSLGAARYDSPPFGVVAAATFFGPSDEVIELLETA
jgi:hypothetical protein